MRCIAHNIPCAVVQFIKGTWQTGEREFWKKISKNVFLLYQAKVLLGRRKIESLIFQYAKSGWEKAKELIEIQKINLYCWMRSILRFVMII